MRTRKTAAPSTSSDDVLQLHCPNAWGELSQEQLRYALGLIGSDLYGEVEIRTMMLIRYCGIDVLKRQKGGAWSCSITQGPGLKHFFDLQQWQVQDMIGQLSFINRPEDMDIRLEVIQGYRAVDELLHGLRFIDYLNLETAYQAWLVCKENHRIVAMARILYRDERGKMADRLELDAAELTGTLFWYFHVKKEFAWQFPNLFRPADKVGGTFNPLEAVNAQLRALSDGDVTKLKRVRQTDCWWCLTELDAKAREAEEFKRKYGNK